MIVGSPFRDIPSREKSTACIAGCAKNMIAADMPASGSPGAARRRRRRPVGHQAQGLDVLATAVEIEEQAGPMLAS